MPSGTYPPRGKYRLGGNRISYLLAIVIAITSFLSPGYAASQEELKEVLGHTPMEAVAGTALGICIAQLAWLLVV